MAWLKNHISTDQLGQSPCSPKRVRTQKTLDPIVREALVGVVLSPQVKCECEWSGRAMV